ncbi:hypothetical protein [Hydrogenophaga sp. 2FB]|uniref:hypothetical protein n=1 Tax=Hydrogenophaga sp. 2FB TaxID=2502187 RepID=UPI0010F57F01|nr:hypothetical protein [Hydrogenophaga sp. 2FB]
MSKLAQLQSSILFQVAGDEALKSQVSDGARRLAAGAALVVAAIMAAPGSAHAQNSPVSPGNCTSFGSAIGGLLGGIAGGDSWDKRALGAAVGAFGGGAIGYGICNAAAEKAEKAKNPPVQVQPQPTNQGNLGYPQVILQPHQGSAHTPVGVQPAGAVRSMPIGDFKGRLISQFDEAGKSHRAEMVALSVVEKNKLDAWGNGVLSKKKAFSDAVIASAEGHGSADAVNAARASFEADRKAFSAVVAKFGTGAPNVAPRDVESQLVLSASILEVPTYRTVTMPQLASADLNLRASTKPVVLDASATSSFRASA